MGVKVQNLPLASGVVNEMAMVYERGPQIVLQLRRLVHGADDVLAASFKSGVSLSVEQAAKLAEMLMRAAKRSASMAKRVVPCVCVKAVKSK